MSPARLRLIAGSSSSSAAFGVASPSWDTIGRLAVRRAGENDARVLVVVSALSGVTND